MVDVELGTVTLLAVDQVSSTDQLRALGDRDGSALQARLLDDLLEVVRLHRGTLVDTAGDGLLAHFPAAALGLAAAQDCLALVARQNVEAPAGAEVLLRAGVHTGDPLLDDRGRVHGMAVVVATRLCAAAEPGQVLVSAMTRALCAHRTELTFGPERDLELKGVGRPVAAAPLDWEPPVVDPVLPELPPLGDSPAFVGRRAELDTLRAAIARSVEGARQVVVIAGEPGVGKTQLATEALREAASTGATVGVGICDADLPAPYQPVVSALACLLGQLPPAAARHLAEAHPVAGHVLAGELPVAEGTTVAERHRLFSDLAGLVRAAAAVTPVCLLIDDVQWATADTIALLRHLVRDTTTAPVLYLLTYRDSDTAQDDPLVVFLADLHRLPGTEQMRLVGLTLDDIRTLAALAAGHELSAAEADVVRRVHDDSAGSPFFATELIRHLLETGGLVPDGDGPVSAAAHRDLPASVRDVVRRRVALLEADAQQVLSLGAVIGQTFPLDVLVAVAGTDELAALTHLEAAMAAGLVEEVAANRFRFRHRLTRTSLYEQLSATRRGHYHRRVGEALERLGHVEDRIEELAYHWSAATVLADTERVARYCKQAGDHALGRQAPDDARRWYERARAALDLADSPSREARCDVLLALGQVQRRLGDGLARATLEEAAALARAVGDSDRLARAVQSMLRAGTFFTEGAEEDSELVALIDEALPGATGASRARLLAARAAERHWSDPPPVLDAATAEALALARSCGDTEVLVEVLLARCVALGGPDYTRERVGLAGEAVRLSRQLQSSELEAAATLTSVCARYELGDPSVLAEFSHLFGLADRLTDRCLVWVIMLLQACRATMVDPALGQAAALEAYRVGQESNQPDASGALAVQLSDVYTFTSNTSEIVERYRQNASDHPVLAFRAGYARVLAQVGRVEEAAQELAAMAAMDFEAPRDTVWLAYCALTADLVIQIGTPQQQQRVYDMLLPFRGRLVFSVWFLACKGTVDQVLGRLAEALGELESARDHLRDAVEAHTRFGHHTWLARCQRDLDRVHAALSPDVPTPRGDQPDQDLLDDPDGAGRSETALRG